MKLFKLSADGVIANGERMISLRSKMLHLKAVKAVDNGKSIDQFRLISFLQRTRTNPERTRCETDTVANQQWR